MKQREIFHICRRAEWDAALRVGVYGRPPHTRHDSFIHFSTAEQVAESAMLHFRGQTDLLLLAADPERLGAALKWETSRNGETFPHLYGDLPVRLVHRIETLRLPDDLADRRAARDDRA